MGRNLGGIGLDDQDFMRRAIALSRAGVAEGGGPFGAVVARAGVILGEGRNNVVPGRDPTAHAEVVAIRRACEAVASHDLSGATLYTSCEPCPMCLAATYWARIGRIVYANSRADAAAIGFDDDFLYREIPLPLEARSVPIVRALAEEAIRVFEDWSAKPDRIAY